MRSGLVAKLLRMQDPDGCFPSQVTRPEWTPPDRNGFTTALVLRALRDLPPGGDIERLRSTALDFIGRCRRPELPTAFGFWPADGRPDWAPRLPADSDDSAIMTVELIRSGRLTRKDGLRTVCLILSRHRLEPRASKQRPPWVAPGAFLTWLDQTGRPNVVDCCANANVAALMTLVGATHLPGFEEAVRTIVNGIEWAGENPVRQQALTPFYPSLDALQEAVAHAVECGATSLRPALNRLQELLPSSPKPAGCCCSAYGGTEWRCAALEEAQALRRPTHRSNRAAALTLSSSQKRENIFGRI